MGIGLLLFGLSLKIPSAVCQETKKKAESAKVYVGAYLNDVQALDFKEHTYAMDVYIWFRWKDETLSPADCLSEKSSVN